MADSTDGARPQSTVDRWAFATVSAVAVGVVLVPAAVVLARGGYTPVSDWALAELAARDTTSGRIAVQGAWSRYGWAHPGPWVTWLLSGGYLVTGRTASGLLWSAFVLSVISAAIGVWLAARVHVFAGVAAVVGFVFVAAWTPAPLGVFDPWNASLAVVLFAVSLIGVWTALGGDHIGGWVGAAAAVLAAGSHIGYVVVVGPVIAAGIGVWWWRLRPRLSRFVIQVWTHRRPAIVASGAAGFILFVPLLVDAVANRPGNLQRIVTWLADPSEAPHGLGTAIRIVGRGSSVTFPFEQYDVFFDELVTPVATGWLPGAMFAVFFAGAWLGWSQRWVRDATVVVVAGWFGVIVAAANLRGPLYMWLVGWVGPLAAFTWIAAVAACACGLRRRTIAAREDSLGHGSRRNLISASVGAVGVVVVAAAGVPASSATVRDPYVWPQLEDSVTILARAIDDAADHRAVRVDFDGDIVVAGALHAAVVNELDRVGADVRVDASLRGQYGSRRIGNHDIAVVVAAEPVTVTRPAHWTTLVVVDAAGPNRARIDTLTRTLTEVALDLGRDDAATILTTPAAGLLALDDRLGGSADGIVELAELRGLGSDRYVAYLVEPNSDP